MLGDGKFLEHLINYWYRNGCDVILEKLITQLLEEEESTVIARYRN